MVHFSFGPNPPAVTLNDAANGGQANARPFELIITVQTLEHAKQLTCVF